MDSCEIRKSKHAGYDKTESFAFARTIFLNRLLHEFPGLLSANSLAIRGLLILSSTLSVGSKRPPVTSFCSCAPRKLNPRFRARRPRCSPVTSH